MLFVKRTEEMSDRESVHFQKSSDSRQNTNIHIHTDCFSILKIWLKGFWRSGRKSVKIYRIKDKCFKCFSFLAAVVFIWKLLKKWVT